MSCMKITRLFTWKTPQPSTQRHTHTSRSFLCFLCKSPQYRKLPFSLNNFKKGFDEIIHDKNYLLWHSLFDLSATSKYLQASFSCDPLNYKNITIPMTPFQHFSSPSTKAWHLSPLTHSSITSNAPLQGKMTQQTISKVTTPPLK